MNEGVRDELADAIAYARSAFHQSKTAVADYELLARYRPEVVVGYLNFRQAVFNVDEDAALDRKTKELVLVAIQTALGKTNPPPEGHVRWALDAGATPAEIAEIVSLCIMMAGMQTYQESGKHALRTAEEYHATLHSQKPSPS